MARSRTVVRRRKKEKTKKIDRGLSAIFYDCAHRSGLRQQAQGQSIFAAGLADASGSSVDR